MWPYLDKAICETIRSTMKPYFDEYIGKFQIKSIDFEILTLGTLPPIIEGIKVYESNEKQLAFEVPLRWAGNPNIVVAVKLLSPLITVQLIDIQISVTPRIVLRPFVPTFPCFSNIVVSLLKKPVVDFGLKVMGGDIMAIPGLYQIIQDIIGKEVCKLYLWPQRLEIPILESSIAVAKPIGILHVKVLRARKLLSRDFLGASDPYVQLSIDGEMITSKKTTIKMKTLNPEWNEDVKLTVKDPHFQVLQLHLYDWDKVGAHDKLGMQEIPLNLLRAYEKKEYTLDLLNSTNPNDSQNKKSRGQITVMVTFIPFHEDGNKFNGVEGDRDRGENFGKVPSDLSIARAGLLLVTVIGADDVEGKRDNNPYALILFRGEKKKTKSIRKTRNPIWNEEFQFVLEEAPLEDQIHIEILNKTRKFSLRSKELMGHVDINLGDVVYNGRINEKYHLVKSKHGKVHVDIQWKGICL